jgi:hypothetical protein
MKSNKLENQINSFLHEYLEFDEKFNDLDDNEKIYVFSILNRLLHVFYTVLKNPNIHPLLFVMTPKSKEVLDNILLRVSYYIPQVMNIKVKILH